MPTKNYRYTYQIFWGHLMPTKNYRYTYQIFFVPAPALKILPTILIDSFHILRAD
jgi:hypothetical protein